MRFFQMVPEPEPGPHDGQRPCQDTRGVCGGGAEGRHPPAGWTVSKGGLSAEAWGAWGHRVPSSAPWPLAQLRTVRACAGSASPGGRRGHSAPPAEGEAWLPALAAASIWNTLCPGAAQTVGFCRFSSELKDACHSPAPCSLSCASESPFFSPTLLFPRLCPPNFKLLRLLLPRSHSSAMNICRTFPTKMPGPLPSLKSSPPLLFLRAHAGCLLCEIPKTKATRMSCTAGRGRAGL